MVYEINNKKVNIPDEVIKNYMVKYEITEQESIEMWLFDNDLMENEEVDRLTQKAKDNKVISTIHQASAVDKTKKKSKPKTVKVSDEKKTLFNQIFSELQYEYGENAQIVKENKLITVKVGEKSFKIDVIETRPPKK